MQAEAYVCPHRERGKGRKMTERYVWGCKGKRGRGKSSVREGVEDTEEECRVQERQVCGRQVWRHRDR